MVRHSGSVAALRFSADEQTLVGNGNDTLVWWERASGGCIRASATEIAAGQAVATVLGEGRALQVTSDSALVGQKMVGTSQGFGHQVMCAGPAAIRPDARPPVGGMVRAGGAEEHVVPAVDPDQLRHFQMAELTWCAHWRQWLPIRQVR